MLEETLTGWTGIAISLCDESGTTSGMNDIMWLSARGCSKPSLIWLLPCRDITCGTWDCLGTISRTWNSSPNVVGDGVAAVKSVGVSQLPEPSFQSSHTSYRSHRTSRLRPSIQVVSDRQASSASAESSPRGAVRFGDCANHPARFIIFAQLAKLCNFLIIILVFPILLIFGTCKIPQTASNNIQLLLKCCFRLCGCRSCLFKPSSDVPALA